MAINYETLFDLQGLAGLENRIPPNVGMNLTGTPNINYLQNLANLAQQQQGPQLGPDEFGSYVIPASDPTYSTGFQYARSIAGGIPMSQVIAPGVSYSPEQPGGYTQAQLNTPVGTTPVEPPPTQEPDDPSFLGTGIGGVNIPIERDKKSARLRDIFGGSKNILPPNFTQAPEGARPGILGNIDFSNLPERGFFSFDPENFKMLQNMGGAFDFDREAIEKIVQERIAENMPTIEQPDLSQFVRREDIPTLIPDVPTGRDFSVDREQLIEDIREGIEIPKYEMPDLSQFARLEDIPKIPSREDFLSIAREGINIPQYQAPDLSGFARLEDIPTFDPNILKQDILMSIPQQQQPDISKFVTQEDIQKAIAGIDIPTYQAPDLSPYDLRLAELEQQLAGLKQPTGGSFSISQPAPRGLF